MVHVDETGFRQGNSDGQNPENKKAWAWTMVSKSLTLFRICLGRGQAHAKELLGEEFKGAAAVGKLASRTDGDSTAIACSDRWSGYNWLPLEQRALCWAHLVREFRRMSERPGESAEIGEALMEQGYQVSNVNYFYRSTTITFSTLAA